MKTLMLCAPLAALLLAARGSWQLPERRLAPRAAAELDEPFSDIVGLRELRDGRVILLDGREQRLVVADLGTGTVRDIARKGGGPNEYANAVRLFALPGDTTWVVDAGAQRILVLGPDAAPAGVLSTLGGTARDRTLTPVALRGVDASGHLYFTGRGVTMTGAGAQPADSVPVLRFDRGRSATTTLATVAQARSQVNVARDGSQVTAVEIVRIPFANGDEWEVGADGRVVIARRDPYRLDIAGSGPTLVRGPVVATETIPITAADKAEYAANLRGATAERVAALPWPEAKPPFLARSVVIAGGETWVRRTARAGSTTARHDVFNDRGQRIATMVTPATHRIALVTARGVYVLRTDDDALQYLERYALPR